MADTKVDWFEEANRVAISLIEKAVKDSEVKDTHCVQKIVTNGTILADLVQVVRCKDCKAYDKEVGYCEAMGFTCEMDDFCSYGERKDNGQSID